MWIVWFCLQSSKYEKEERNAIVKKMKGASAEAKRPFEKEPGIANTVKGPRNVAGFLRFCQDPYAIMMEYSCFGFSPFGVDKKVSSLEDFVSSPNFTSPRFTNPRLTSPVQSSPGQSRPVPKYSMPAYPVTSIHFLD